MSGFSTIREDIRVSFAQIKFSPAIIYCDTNVIEVDKKFWNRCSDLEKIQVIECLRYIKQNPDCYCEKW